MSTGGESRRGFIRKTVGVGLAGFAAGCSSGEKKEGAGAKPGEEEVSPAEDLMREHGVLNRLLLIYEEAIRRLESTGDLKPEILSGTAKIIKRFIEEYHEKLEEDHLFPRFEKAGKLVDLVRTLKAQHEAGRRVTTEILALTTAKALSDPESRKKLAKGLNGFIRMYRPHEAREDTVLFPALHQIVSAREYDALGEDFEKKEHELFGKEGFEGMVEKTSELEKALGIYDLSQFTPR